MFQKYRTLISLLVASVLPSACSGPVQEARQSRVIPWWIWLLVIVVALLVFIWLWLTSPKEEREVPTAQVETAAPSHVVETPEGLARHPAPVVKAPEPDDLKRMENPPSPSPSLPGRGIPCSSPS
jgi:HAMP domain-containing protein